MKFRNHIFMPRFLHRILSLLLIVILCSSTLMFNYAAAYSGVIQDFKLVSNMVNTDKIQLCFDEDYYISIDALCVLTRCKATREGEKYVVTQGIWRTTFDLDEEVFNDGWQTVNISLLQIDKKFYVPALMFLSYFGANAHIDAETNTLYSIMPNCTAWEALKIDYENSLVDIYELYGGEGNITLSLTLDIIMDFILNGTPDSNKYLLAAFNTALAVDMTDYGSIQSYQQERDETFYDFLISNEGRDATKYANSLLDGSISAVEYLCESYYNTLNIKFADLVKQTYRAGLMEESTHYAEEILKGYRKSKTISDLADYSKIPLTQVAPVLIQTALESAQQLKYTSATNNLVYRVMGSENTAKWGLSVEDNEWFQLANSYRNTATVVSNNFLNNAIDSFADMGWDQLIGDCVEAFTGTSALLFQFSKQTASMFVKLFPLTSPSVQAFEADRIAIYLSELQRNVFYVVSKIDLEGKYTDKDAYQNLVEAELFYCRVSIAMYENLITMVKEFGKNRNYWISLFQSRIDALAVSMYKLTLFQDDGVESCFPLDLTSFNSNSSSINLEELVTDAYSNEVTYKSSLYNDYTQSFEEQIIVATYKIPQINLQGEEIKTINSKLFEDYYPIIQDSLAEISEYECPFTSAGISYKWSVNGDVLSLVVCDDSSPEYSGGYVFTVLNISIADESRLSTSDVLAAAGFSTADYANLAKMMMGSFYWGNIERNNENFNNKGFVNLFNEMLEKTISDSNVAEALPYINSNGELCLIARIYSLAGADYYWHDLIPGNFTIVPDYSKKAEFITHTISLSEDDAYHIACSYWNYKSGDIDEETGFELFLINDGIVEDQNYGKSYYEFRLRWLVENHLSTIDTVYIDAETGNCYSDIPT